ncbi:MAG: DUF4234 domain-containing protein [Thermoplasmatota archaeon]
MVAPTKVGKQRSFGRGLLLTIVTFGIYSLYWNWQANKELFDQFELKKEGREDNMVWFIVGIILTPLLWVYQYKAVENVNYLRSRFGLPPLISPLAFLMWNIFGWILLLFGPLYAYNKLQHSINDVWDQYDRRAAELRAQGLAPATPPVPPIM